MPRPKTVSEEAVLDAAVDILRSGGPDALTLAAAGEKAGLSPATLLQRYGTKDRLMQAALERMWDHLDAATARADAGCPLSAEGAIALLVGLSSGYGEGEDPAQGLLLLREDFRDPVLRARGAAWAEALALAAGRRLTMDSDRQVPLGRLMVHQWQGAVLFWGFSRNGTIGGHVRRQLRAFCREILGRPD